jgi:uncharacterized iron-regulated membrane protein
MKPSKLNRDVHRWGSIITAVPVLVIVVTGIILQLKKDVAWIQPPTGQGTGRQPTITFDRILQIASRVADAKIDSWDDVDRLDVRPARGIVKVRAKSRWEIQIDASTGEVYQVGYRRSDLIESMHDGSFFHPMVKLGVFLPTAVVLLILWATGVYLFVMPYLSQRKKKAKESHFLRKGES